MTKSILKLSLLSLLAIAVGGLVVQARAQETDKPTVEKKESKKSGVTPFHGKLKAVDTTAKTITVGELTIQITSDTKISKAGKPATLEDGVVATSRRNIARESGKPIPLETGQAAQGLPFLFHELYRRHQLVLLLGETLDCVLWAY
jgi:hypothetical protein